MIAKANNLNLNIVHANLGDPSIEHLKVNKLGKIPTFVDEDNFVVSECLALAIYCWSTADFRFAIALHQIPQQVSVDLNS